MNAYKDEKIKFATIAVMAVLVFSVCVVLFTDSSMAEEEEGAEVTSETIKIGGEDYDVFEYLGVYYVITSEKESEEEVGVIGLDFGYLKDHVDFIVVCQFVDPDDEEVTYSVTSIEKEFAQAVKEMNEKSAEVSMYLANSITSLAADCFKDITFTSIHKVVMPEECDAEMVEESGISNGTYTLYEDATTSKFIYYIGDVKKVVKENYNDDYAVPNPITGETDYKYEQEFADGITVTVMETEFDNPEYDLDVWTNSAEVELAVDDQILSYGTAVVYLPVADVTLDPTVDPYCFEFTAQWVENEDYLGDGMYEEWMMWATAAIIIILAIIGLTAFSYRTVLAHKG